MLLPALWLYLYGPRQDLAPPLARARRLVPRYALRRDVLWLGLVPLGLILYMAYLGLNGGSIVDLAFHAEAVRQALRRAEGRARHGVQCV